MPKVLDDLHFDMSMMFIDNNLKTYDVQDVSEESKVKYLRRIIQYCERKYDQEYEPQKSGASDGWLLLKDQEGKSHDVAYRGVWSIEKLKDLLADQFSCKPDDLHLSVLHDSYSSVA
jgi:hypothetical protein